MFTRWQTQKTEREDAKMCSKQDLSNFLTYHLGNDTQGSREFIRNFLYIIISRPLNMVQKSNDCTCVT